jgi:AcrR family transcriptional regulator
MTLSLIRDTVRVSEFTDIRTAAFRLFAERGYDETSVDEIAAAAGISRSTFFRQYGSKEAVIFPDHDEMLEQVERRLRSSHADSALLAVTDAVRTVLVHYVDEGDRARERYRLTSTVPTLRERELVSGARYQRLFRRYLSGWGDGSDDAELRAEVTAAAVVAAHNRVLRRWLRGECDDPAREVGEALAVVQDTFDRTSAGQAAVIVVAAGASMAAIEETVRRALGPAVVD